MDLECIIDKTTIDKQSIASSYSYDFALKEITNIISKENYSSQEKQKVLLLSKEVVLRFSGAYSSLKKNLLEKLRKDDSFFLNSQKDENRFLSSLASEYVLRYSLSGFEKDAVNTNIDFSSKSFPFISSVFEDLNKILRKSSIASKPSKKVYSLLKDYFSSMQKQAIGGLDEKTQELLSETFSINIGGLVFNKLSTLKYFPLEKNLEKEVKLKSESSIDRFSVELSKINLSKPVTYDSVQGNLDSKNFLRSSVRDLLLYNPITKINPLLELGSFNNLVLLAGDAGTGKTFTAYYAISEAKSIAEKFGVDFESIKLNIESSYQDGSLLMLKSQLHEISSSNKTYIVFLDDCEKYFPDRSTSRLDHKKDVVTEFLHFTQGLNGYKNRGNYLLVATANLPQTLDKALLSRFGDAVFHCEGPVSPEEKVNVLKQNLSVGLENGFVEVSDWGSIGEIAFDANMKGRDLYNIAKTLLGESRSSMNYNLAYENVSSPEKVKEILLNSYKKITDENIRSAIDTFVKKKIVLKKAQESYLG